MASSSRASTSNSNIDITMFISRAATNRKHISFKIRSHLVMQMLLDGVDTDITLESGGGYRFRAHTSVLASHSPVFKTIFDTRDDKKTNPIVPEIVKGMTDQSLKLFVVLLYLSPVLEDPVIMNGLENAVALHLEDLIEGRLKYKVPQLDPILTKVLAKILTPQNCGKYLYYWMIVSLNNSGSVTTICSENLMNGFVKDMAVGGPRSKSWEPCHLYPNSVEIKIYQPRARDPQAFCRRGRRRGNPVKAPHRTPTIPYPLTLQRSRVRTWSSRDAAFPESAGL